MSGVEGGSGAARRRRDRRLRAWWRHEQLGVKAGSFLPCTTVLGSAPRQGARRLTVRWVGTNPLVRGSSASLMLLLRRFLCLLVDVLLLLDLCVTLGCLCRVWHRMIVWMMPRFRFLLERNLVARAQGDGGDVSEALVASLSPSPLPMSEVSWPEARWSWYLAHPTGPPDLCQFSGSGTHDLSLTAGVSNSVFGSSSSSHGVSSSSPRAAEFPTTRASSKRSKPLPSCVQSAGFDAVSPVVSPWMPMPTEDLCTFAHTLRASP